MNMDLPAILVVAGAALVAGLAGFAIGKAASSAERPATNAAHGSQIAALAAERLAQLQTTLEAVGAASDLNPPASEATIASLERRLGFALPDELRTLYRWHDGGGRLIDFSFYPISQVQAHYDLLTQGREAGDSQGSRNLIPIAGDDGHYLLMRADAADRAIYASHVETPGLSLQFESLDHLIRITDEAHLSGAIHRAYEGWELDEPLYRRLLAKIAGGPNRQRAAGRIDEAVAADTAALVYDRYAAIQRLGNDPLATSTLIGLLKDRDRQIATRAAFALGTLRAREAIADLLQLIGTDEHRAMAVHALARIVRRGDDHLAPVLLEMLTDHDKQVRISALQGLGSIRSPATVSQVVSALDDPDTGVLPYAVDALGQMADQRALPDLRSLHARADTLGLDPTYRGGSRGSAPTPAYLRLAIEKAIAAIEAGT